MTSLKIAVLGAGNIGGAIGRKWVAAGHQVAFGVNDPDGKHAEELRNEFGDKISVGMLAEVLDTEPSVVLLAIPGKLADETIADLKDQLNGKIIIDATNRIGVTPMSSFAALQQYTPQAQLYRTFNFLGWENFADATFEGGPADLFFCGADGEPRTVVEELISDVGFQPMYLGGVDQVGVVDSLFHLFGALAFKQNKGRVLAFKVLTR